MPILLSKLLLIYCGNDLCSLMRLRMNACMCDYVIMHACTYLCTIGHTLYIYIYIPIIIFERILWLCTRPEINAVTLETT